MRREINYNDVSLLTLKYLWLLLVGWLCKKPKQTGKFIPLIKAVTIFIGDYNTKGQTDMPKVLPTKLAACCLAFGSARKPPDK